MKKETFLEIVLWAILALPLVYLAIEWPQMPEIVPTHFNAQGEADGFSNKTSLIWLMLFVLLFPTLLLRFVPQLDPRRKPEDFGVNYMRLRLIIGLFMAATAVIMVRSAVGKVDVAMIIPVLLGGLFAGIGNYISTVKSNYFVGIRTPWTLENDEVWRKTHRLGGRTMFWGGIACIVLSFVLPKEIRLFALIALVVLSSLVPVVYSYVVYRQVKKNA